MALPRVRSKIIKEHVYSDFPIDFSPNPVTNDIKVLTNERAINSALKNLLLVSKGEYLFQPTKGSGLYDMLFENRTPATLKIMKETVQRVIKEYEPRASLISVDVLGELDSNAVTVKITYQPIHTEDPVVTEFLLERTR